MAKYWTVQVIAWLATLLALFVPAQVARADIFQWEYINPANPGLGKQQSTTLAPDGAGVSAVPAANFSNRNLTKAYLIGANLAPVPVFDEEGGLIYFIVAALNDTNLSQADLTGADLQRAYLIDANFSHANLSNVNFFIANLAGANLFEADVRGAYFHGFHDSDITVAQLYSTASYKDHDLTRIQLIANNLADIDLAGQNLTHANFGNSTLTGGNLSGADAQGTGFAYGTLVNVNLSYANLTNAYFYAAMLTDSNLTQANLANADFYSAVLTGADLTGADVRGAKFLRDSGSYPGSTGITVGQLYSTASYQTRDLSGIKLGNNNLAGINLAGQNLTNADFSGLALCDENGCSIPQGTDLTGAILTGADVRGANFQGATINGANINNLIQSDGRIAGLGLAAGATLVVHDYDGNPTADPAVGLLPIVVDGHLAMSGTGTMKMVFDADAWDSTISFAQNISVTRGGTLELTFAPDVSLAGQIGRTIDLFDWSGVTPIGTFNVSSPYIWNLANLYTTGEVTLISLAAPGGDFNDDGAIDAADYVAWRKLIGTALTYNDWRTQFGQTGGIGAADVIVHDAVPEPATIMLLAAGVFLASFWRNG